MRAPRHRRPRRVSPAGSSSREHADFTSRLRALGFAPRRDGIWLKVGSARGAAGWKLHVSSTRARIGHLFRHVLPLLARRGTPFKMAAEPAVVLQMNCGTYGETQIGKVVTVYPRDDREAAAVGEALAHLTRNHPGPAVATDLRVGGSVYARYGAYRSRCAHDRFGIATDLVPDGSGQWVPDSRAVPYAAPAGIVSPFANARAVAGPPRAGVRTLLGGRYFVTDVLHPGLAGSVLRAIDVRAAGGPAACVLKQARAHCGEDDRGRDRRARLRHESEMLRRLGGRVPVARGGRYFECDGIGYLPLEYVPGESLAQVLARRVADRPWYRLRVATRGELLGYVRQLVQCLEAAHAQGVVHRDLSPNNVWIGARGRVHLIDWECAHVVGSREPLFRLGTAGFSDRGPENRAPSPGDDWQVCARIVVYVLTGLNPEAIVHGTSNDIIARLATLAGGRASPLIELLAHTLAESPAGALDGRVLRRALAAELSDRGRRRAQARRRASPCASVPTPAPAAMAPGDVLDEGLELAMGDLGALLARLRSPGPPRAAGLLDAHDGVAGLLYLLAQARRAGMADLGTAVAARAVRVLTDRTAVVPDFPGLLHGRAGRALAVAATIGSGAIAPDHTLRDWLATALAGVLDWPDLTHGATGQGLAALGCARRLGIPQLAAHARACAAYLARTQDADGAWTLPAGAPGASGERFTGFAHGAAGMMAFLGCQAAAGDGTAEAAWRRAERWLVSRAQPARGGALRWPQSDRHRSPWGWWCHGAPGIALGWLTVARARGVEAIAEEHLRGALRALPAQVRSASLGQCHGLAGLGEIYLDAHRVLGEDEWLERAADIARVLTALYRRMPRRGAERPWPRLESEPESAAAGLMLGTAGILHFLLRFRRPDVLTHAPFLA